MTGDTEPAPAPPPVTGGVAVLAQCGACCRTYTVDIARHETWSEALSCLIGAGWRFERGGIDGWRVLGATCPKCSGLM